MQPTSKLISRATNLTVTTEFLMMILLMLWKKKTLLKNTWPTVSSEHLSVGALKPFLHIAVQGALAKFGTSLQDATML